MFHLNFIFVIKLSRGKVLHWQRQSEVQESSFPLLGRVYEMKTRNFLLSKKLYTILHIVIMEVDGSHDGKKEFSPNYNYDKLDALHL